MLFFPNRNTQVFGHNESRAMGVVGGRGDPAGRTLLGVECHRLQEASRSLRRILGRSEGELCRLLCLCLQLKYIYVFISIYLHTYTHTHI